MKVSWKQQERTRLDYKVDYHIHSYYSDGTMSPVELVKKYNDENYDIISITDHDNIKAFQEAKIAGEALNITVVPGVELSTEHTLTLEADADAQHPAGSEVSVELHLLGYQFDPQNEALVRRLAELEENRKARNEQLAVVLTAMGYPVDLQALAAASKGGYVGKPHIARAWVAQGLIAQLKDAWEPGKRLESPEVKAIRKKKMETTEAIALLQQAGGMAVLAHPGKIRGLGERGSEAYWTNLTVLLRELKKAGLKGLECFYPDHSEAEVFRFTELAGKLHLHMTEGSDFHGEA